MEVQRLQEVQQGQMRLLVVQVVMVDMEVTIIERHKQSALSHYARALPWIWGKHTVLTESKTSNFSGSVPQHVFCRRVSVMLGVTYTNLLGATGDRVKMDWSSPQTDVDGDFSGPVDPEVFVLSVQHTDGRPLSYSRTIRCTASEGLARDI